MTDSELRAFIKSIPKTETHLHFEGALPMGLLRSKYPEKYDNPPASWADDFKFRSFEHFEEELLGYAFDWFESPDAYYEAAKVVFADLVGQNVRYLETSFASGLIEFGGLDGEAILDALHAAKPDELELRVFMGIHHTGFGDHMQPVLRAALGWDKLAGIDLHGMESVPVPDVATTYWQAARDAGKFTKAHAGEFCGADFVRFAVETLGVSRVEHGVRASEDPAVVALLRERDVTLDVCPISNIKLDVFPTYAEHSLPQLVDAGVRCTINSDDPVSFGNRLTDDYMALVQRMGFKPEALKDFARNGLKVALVDQKTRSKWLQELDNVS